MADGGTAGNLLNGNIANILNFLSAAAALGSAATAVVDNAKAFWGGPSNFGLRYIRDAVSQLLPGPPDEAGLPTAMVVQLLRANWLNGVPMPDQIARAKGLVSQSLKHGNAAPAARLVGVDPALLTAALRKNSSGGALTADEAVAVGQFDTMVGAVLDAAYQRADQAYRNGCKALAMVAATVLSAIGGWVVYGSAQPDAPLTYFVSWQFPLSLLVGLSASLLAPVAKDLATAIKAAAAGSNLSRP